MSCKTTYVITDKKLSIFSQNDLYLKMIKLNMVLPKLVSLNEYSNTKFSGIWSNISALINDFEN